MNSTSGGYSSGVRTAYVSCVAAPAAIDNEPIQIVSQISCAPGVAQRVATRRQLRSLRRTRRAYSSSSQGGGGSGGSLLICLPRRWLDTGIRSAREIQKDSERVWPSLRRQSRTPRMAETTSPEKSGSARCVGTEPENVPKIASPPSPVSTVATPCCASSSFVFLRTAA